MGSQCAGQRHLAHRAPGPHQQDRQEDSLQEEEEGEAKDREPRQEGAQDDLADSGRVRDVLDPVPHPRASRASAPPASTYTSTCSHTSSATRTVLSTRFAMLPRINSLRMHSEE